nr:glucose-6-phosphate isomerase [Synechococcus sp. RSCCF101]
MTSLQASSPAQASAPAASSGSSWERYQEWLYHHPELGCFLDISRTRVDAALERQLAEPFAAAFEAMAALEQGAIANPDEQRMVGHYWLRDPQLAPSDELRQAIETDLEQIESFAAGVISGAIRPPRAERFTDLLAIGIGGSALGPEFVAEALAPDEPPLAIHFIDNTDPAGIDRVLRRLQGRLASTLVVDTSKSGGTPEPRNGMLEVRHAFEREGLSFPPQAVATTMRGSHMDQLAREESWLAEFPMYDWVGGRTSELSAVGLLPAALQGIDIRAMLDGARQMDGATRVADVRRNPAALLAMSWHAIGNGRGEKDMVLLPYKDSLLLFSRYLQQLVMESLGKAEDLDGRLVHQGIAVYGNKGSTDQHAYVQQLRDGVPNFFVTFIEVLEDRSGPSIEVERDVTAGDYLSGFLLGTRQALHENQRESITITIPRVDARRVGALIALYERAVGLYASLVNINAYHQPGVEAGKKAAATILDLQRQLLDCLRASASPLDLEALATAAGAGDRLETVYQVVRHLLANGRLRCVAGEPACPHSLVLAMPEPDVTATA